jgi:hypothetical protein
MPASALGHRLYVTPRPECRPRKTRPAPHPPRWEGAGRVLICYCGVGGRITALELP